MTKFSVIIPIYNAEKYLHRCILSVIKQTYKNFEIILVDDGSKDNSGKICDEYAQKDSRIKVIHQANSGVSIARNVGLEKSIGDYIIFIDSDDFVEFNMLQKLNYILENNEVDCIIHNFNSRLKTKFVSHKELSNCIINLIKTELINSPCNKVYRRDILKKYNIIFNKKIDIGEDLLFNITYVSKIRNMYLFNDRFYNYTKENNNSITTKYIPNKYEQLMFVDKKIKEQLKIYNNERLLECEKFVRLKNIFSCFMDLSKNACKKSKKQKVQFIKKVKRENNIIIRKLGIKLFLFSIIYFLLPSEALLLLSKIVFIRKTNRQKFIIL